MMAILGAALCLCASTASAQRISIGAVAGGYTNSDFVSHYIPMAGFLPNIAISDAGGYIVGPTMEVRLIRNLSFVADGLYKPLHYEQAATFYPDGRIGYAPATVVTWQFPLLAKYRFSSRRFRPFIEGGPSFRTSGNLNQTAPSHRGVSAGAGLEWRPGSIAIGPGVRYTRWAEDRASRSRFPLSGDVQTRADQVEFLFRITWGPSRKER